MEDKTLQDIKNGKGLQPLKNDTNSSSSSSTSGLTVEQRAQSDLHGMIEKK